MQSPLGKNEIGKFLSTAGKNASLQGIETKHSVRRTCISCLLDSKVSNNFVAQLSGHRNQESLDVYKSASYEHQRRMSLALSRLTGSLDLTNDQLPTSVASQLSWLERSTGIARSRTQTAS